MTVQNFLADAEQRLRNASPDRFDDIRAECIVDARREFDDTADEISDALPDNRNFYFPVGGGFGGLPEVTQTAGLSR
jgi:hypothetical protein